MSTTRYRSGNVTVSLDGGLDAFVRSMVSAAETETVRVLERAAEDVVVKARTEVYGPKGVTRRTGRLGDVQRVTTFDGVLSEVRVGVGFTDTRLDPKRRGRVPYFVRRAGPLSVVRKVVTQREWWAWKKAGKPVAIKLRGQAPWQIEVPNPKASDGKSVVVELIRKPVAAKVREVTPALAQAIATRSNKGGR
jgi:hypothetical protein